MENAPNLINKKTFNAFARNIIANQFCAFELIKFLT